MANMQHFGFFDYAEGDSDDYKYTSSEFSDLIEGLAGTGVSYEYGDRFDYTTAGLTVNLSSGGVFIKGRFGFNTEGTTITLSPVSSGQSRIDTVCATLDVANRIIKLEAVKGTSTNPPTLTSNQVPILNARITYSSGGASIASTEDARIFTYTSSKYPSSQIIYSKETPEVVNGAIWLQPLE